MPRKKKSIEEIKTTVDWFPHYVTASDSDTIKVLENMYGDTGYAFWWRLLERLGQANQNYLDLSKSDQMTIFCSIVKMNEQDACKCLDVLATIDSIDKKYWVENRIVWSPRFINEIKGKHVRNGISVIAPGHVIPLEKKDRASLKKGKAADTVFGEVTIDPIIISIQQDIGYMNQNNYSELEQYRQDLGDDLVQHAIDEAVAHKKRSWSYVRSILSRYQENDIRCVGDIDNQKGREDDEPVRFV